MATKKTAPQAEKASASKAAPKKKILVKAPAPNQPSAIEQMALLQAQVEALSQEATQEIRAKLSAARQVVKELEAQLASLTLKSVGARVRRSR